MTARKRNGFLVYGALLCVVLVTVTLGIDKLTAATPFAGSYLTNVAVMTWTGGSQAVTNTRLVGTNFGGIWVGETNQIAIAGTETTNSTVISNMGNGIATYVLTSAIKDDAAAQSWTTEFRNISDAGARAASISVNISAFGYKDVDFYVAIPGTETNGSYLDYMCQASNALAAAINATSYTGMDGSTAYGGQIGEFGAPVGAFWLATNTAYSSTNWILTVAAPDLSLTKSIEAVDQPGGGIYTGSDPVPGARITYKLVYANNGSAGATSVRIIDMIPTNYVTYVAGSLRQDGNTAATWATAATTPTDADDADEGAYTNCNRVFFAPNGDAIAGNGTMAATEDGAYFYRIYVK